MADEIFGEEFPKEGNSTVTVAADTEIPTEEKKVKIVLEDPGNGSNYHYVGVNGKGYQIMYGEEVWVPISVYEVLKNAVAAKLVQKKGQDGRTINTYRPYNRVPFRVLSQV